ncbi:uncharacterized protein N0V96_002795 [Colletotrichum fioriniae]|uniref:uncharacterized protein n=1 Tax=Colletotrichum fioriniae TaxID=710243 RepID=UPI0032DA6907|nr:hypothetical protein N0V96_002795 [Colletotrichum fioriniae]
MEFLVRFSQAHESFRLPELQALADLEGIDMKVVEYSLDSPFCIITLPQSTSPPASTSTFKFSLDTYQSSRPHASFVSLINAYKYLPLHGAIDLKTPELHLTIFEDWDLRGTEGPKRVHLARFLATGARSLSLKYDLKKRGYISTTSMDSELALVTANLAHAAPGKLFYDPSGDFIAPKKPYSFLAMLDDILEFASETLVDGGRLSFWMPTANDEDQEIPTPQHPRLDIVVTCVQPFNKCYSIMLTPK